MGRLCSEVLCISFLRERYPFQTATSLLTALINFLLNMNKSLNQEVFLTSSQSKMYWLVFLGPYTDQNGRFPYPFIYFN